MNKKEEHWLQLPESIYGSGVCYLIVYSELLKQLEGLTTDAVDFSRSFNEIKNLKYTAFYRLFVLFFQITFTFLIQGVLIWMVWTETPSPDDFYQLEWNEEVNGLCSVSVFLQLAAIGTLCLWTMSSFTDVLTELRCYVSRVFSREIVLSGRYNLRRIGNREIIYHIAFGMILVAEIFISFSMFIAGVNFVLSQIDAADIVQGVLGISFIVDIDNKVYENSFIDEDDLGNVKIVSFRTTELDLYDAFMAYWRLQDSDVDTAKKLRDKSLKDKAMGHAQVISQAALFNIIQWPVLIVVVVTVVLGMRGNYCDDFNSSHPGVP